MIRRPAVHVAALMRTLVVVMVQVLVQVLLHFGHRFVELLAPLDAEVLVQECAVEAFHKAVALGPAHPGGAVLDAFELQEQLIRVDIRPAAILAAVVAEDGLNWGLVLFEEGQDIQVQHVDGGYRELGVVETAPAEA